MGELEEGDCFSIKPMSEIDDENRKFYFASIVWTIADFSYRARRAGEEIRSPHLWCKGTAWTLSVFPNGERWNGTVGEVAIYLKKDSMDYLKHTVVSEMIVYHEEDGHLTSTIKHTFDINNFSCKFPTVLSRAIVVRRENGYSPDDCFTITCHIFLLGKESLELPSGAAMTNLIGENPPERKDAGTNTSSRDFENLVLHKDPPKEKGDNLTVLLSKDFETLHINQKYADVILKVGEREFSAHKLVLRSRSKVFEAMFEHDMQENRQATVDLVDMEVDTVKDMLRYIYCGKVRQLSPEEALGLYVAADRYDLEELVLYCRMIVLNTLSINNICEISAVADLHNDQLLMDAVKSLLSKEAKQVLKTAKWLMFSKENPILSLNLIQTVILNS